MVQEAKGKGLGVMVLEASFLSGSSHHLVISQHLLQTNIWGKLVRFSEIYFPQAWKCLTETLPNPVLTYSKGLQSCNIFSSQIITCHSDVVVGALCTVRTLLEQPTHCASVMNHIPLTPGIRYQWNLCGVINGIYKRCGGGSGCSRGISRE